MNSEDKTLTVVIRDKRYGKGETTYETKMPVEEFYKLMGVENSDGFYERFEPEIKAKITAKAATIDAKIIRLEQKVDVLTDAVNRASNIRQELTQIVHEAETAKQGMEETIERYETTRRAPGSEAHSISPDGETWVCDKCGTIMGRMSLYGKDGSGWRKTPRYCPGCGAKNVDDKDEDHGYAKAGRRL